MKYIMFLFILTIGVFAGDDNMIASNAIIDLFLSTNTVFILSLSILMISATLYVMTAKSSILIGGVILSILISGISGLIGKNIIEISTIFYGILLLILVYIFNYGIKRKLTKKLIEVEKSSQYI